MHQSSVAPNDGTKNSMCLTAGILFLSMFLWPIAVYCHSEELEAAAARNYTRTKNSNKVLGSGKVIYGTDDRLEVYEVTDPLLSSWAASTCALVDDQDLVDNGDGTYTLTTEAYLQAGRPACPDEPFGDQPIAAFCTGFMVGDDSIATAGHCVAEDELAGMRFLFGFDMVDATTPVVRFDENQLYRGTEIIKRKLTNDDDYALIRVDRPITAPEAYALPLRQTGTIAMGSPVGVIGHPAGLPKKLAFGSDTRVRENDAASYFNANLDTYGGNSGSPVFNVADHLVEGILVRGNTDYTIDIDCFRSNVMGNDVVDSERVTRSITFSGWVYGTIAPPENDLFEQAAVFPENADRVTGTNEFGTRESGEPEHAGGPGAASVWWRWTAPFDGGVALDTRMSDFDTLLAVYTGNTLATISLVASNDDMPNSRQSRATFTAARGTVYHFAVDGFEGQEGDITLSLAPLLSVTPETSTVAGDAGTTLFTVRTAASWMAYSDQPWASLSADSGTGTTVLTISLTENGDRERSAIIKVTGEGTSPAWAAFVLLQEAKPVPFCCLSGKQKNMTSILQYLFGDGIVLGLSFVALWGYSRLGRNRFGK